MTTHLLSPGLDDEDFLVALANTAHDPDAPDELGSVEAAAAWWSEVSGVAVAGRFGSAADLELLRSARTVIRQVGLRNNGVGTEVDPGALASVPLAFDVASGLRTTTASSPARDLATRAVVALVRLPARADARRFKACPGPECAWVFRDTTRNGSRRWCDMAACGNRAKAAAFRARTH